MFIGIYYICTHHYISSVLLRTHKKNTIVFLVFIVPRVARKEFTGPDQRSHQSVKKQPRVFEPGLVFLCICTLASATTTDTNARENMITR